MLPLGEGSGVSAPVVALVGPTGIGKTAAAVAIAQALAPSIGCEVINADSRQIYRYMEIGTAKPTPAEQAAVPHHLLDVVNPDQTLTLPEYQALAAAAIRAVHERGSLALLVGGTGQYITAVLEGWQAPQVAPDATLRAELEEYAQLHGAEGLFERLRALDPEAAQSMDRFNVRRTIRALEVCINTGQPFSAQRRKVPPPYHVLELALSADRAMLYARLDSRIDAMLRDGFLTEIQALYARGYGAHLPSMSGLGYKQLGAHLRGETSLDAAVQQTKFDTHQFVRRQYTWFRKHGSPLWLESPSHAEIIGYIARWLHIPAQVN